MAKTAPFEKFSDRYDAWFDDNKAKYELELQAVGKFIPKTGKGLEIGVGSGKFAGPLGIKTGLDPAYSMLLRAQTLGIRVIQGVAEQLPLADHCFDFALMVTTICFVDDLNQSFREAFRILKHDGFLVIGFIDKQSELGKQYSRNKDKSEFYKIANFFSTQEILSLLTDNGFGLFNILQTLIPGNASQAMEKGFGKGSFVVIKAIKLKQ